MASNPGGPDPAIQRRRLRSELRKAREAASKTQRDVAAAMDWSVSKLIRIETGDVRVSTNDLRVLLGYYGAGVDYTESMIRLARAAREPARWSLYRDVASPDFISFLGYESSASVIRNFEPLLLPGLLQTEEYARAVIEILDGPHRLDALVDLRMQRQELLTQDPGPQFHFIIDEATIRRKIGGEDAMRRQVRHLKEIAEWPNVNVGIMPFDHGMYAGMRLAYVLFEFEAAEDKDILFIENPGDIFLVGGSSSDSVIRESSPQSRGRVSPADYLRHFRELERVTKVESTQDILDRVLRGLSTHDSSVS